MDDKSIIELYFARSEDAIAETSRKYGKYCRYIAMSVLGNEQDAEEIENDTYLRIWNSIPPNKPDPLKPYVGRVARNLALDRYDGKNAQKRGEPTLALEELSECISDGDGEIGERIALRVALDSFLGSLEKRTRVVFMQRYFYLCPIGEIAKRNGMKASAVTMLLFRTRKKLKEHLDKEGIEL